jgi:hypothetical protein
MKSKTKLINSIVLPALLNCSLLVSFYKFSQVLSAILLNTYSISNRFHDYPTFSYIFFVHISEELIILPHFTMYSKFSIIRKDEGY